MAAYMKKTSSGAPFVMRKMVSAIQEVGRMDRSMMHLNTPSASSCFVIITLVVVAAKRAELIT